MLTWRRRFGWSVVPLWLLALAMMATGWFLGYLLVTALRGALDRQALLVPLPLSASVGVLAFVADPLLGRRFGEKLTRAELRYYSILLGGIIAMQALVQVSLQVRQSQPLGSILARSSPSFVCLLIGIGWLLYGARLNRASETQ